MKMRTMEGLIGAFGIKGHAF
jgi:hypothetical protein